MPTATPPRSGQIFLRPHRPTPYVPVEANRRHDGNIRGSDGFSFGSREAMQIDRRSRAERAGGGSRPQDMRLSAIGTVRSRGSPTAALGISTAVHEQVRRCGDGWDGSFSTTSDAKWSSRIGAGRRQRRGRSRSCVDSLLSKGFLRSFAARRHGRRTTVALDDGRGITHGDDVGRRAGRRRAPFDSIAAEC